MPSKCYFCSRETNDDQYCHGCEHHICDECDVSLGLMGSHEPEEHLEEEYPDNDFDQAMWYMACYHI